MEFGFGIRLIRNVSLSRFLRLLIGAPAFFHLLPLLNSAENIELPELVTVGRRFSDFLEQSPYPVVVLGAERINQAPARRLDEVLKQVPGFSLFRRNSSRVAHPTTQGVSLRNLGPNGAGRTLVLRDGLPLNDPFGGWVYWNRFSLAGIEGVEIQSGGGAGPWGNSALGGVIQIFSRQSMGDYALAEISGGNRGTSEVFFSGNKKVGNIDFFLNANRFSTNGYPVLREDQRGPVDTNAYSKAETVEGGFKWKLSQDKTLAVRAGRFYEKRGNGTLITGNDTEAYDASISLSGGQADGNLRWRTQFYYQQRTFRNLFSSVAADRGSEQPALEQFDVPAEAWGASVVVSFTTPKGHRLLAGIDGRRVEGKTRERFRFVEGSFLREREAGGEQVFFGLFIEDIWEINPALRLHAGGRLDYFRDKNGFRLEKDRTTQEVLRDEKFTNRDDWVGNFRIGLSADIGGEKRAFVSVYSGFRAPTLNELYRPFRVRNDITEANPLLSTERLYGVELGMEWTPAESSMIRVNIFANFLRDAVANVFLTPGPGLIEPCGFVPSGGSCRQRRNLDEVRVAGFELKGEYKINENWSLSLGYLFSDSNIEKNPGQAVLEGNRLAQTPEHTLHFSIGWRPAPKWRSSLQIRFTGNQFEENRNEERLGAFTVMDWSFTYQLRKDTLVFATIENLLDTEFETGKSSSGLVSIGAPLLATIGLRRQF